MPEVKKRTSATLMMKAVSEMETWKLNVLFGVGIVTMGGIVWWFVTPKEGHEHMITEMIVAGIIFFVAAFFAFPLGITRLADKFWPEKWKAHKE